MSDNGSKEELIQFRVDKSFGTKLSAIADRLQTPVGPLARLWVAQRLQQELGSDSASSSKWRDDRLLAIAHEFSLNKPYVVIHIVPVDLEQKILPETMPGIARLLLPPFRKQRSNVVGRINQQGYRSSNFQQDREVSYVQLWKSGYIEAAGKMPDDDNRIYGRWLDTELIESARNYCLALTGLQIRLPLRIYISLIGVKGFTFADPSDKFLGEHVTPVSEQNIILSEIEAKSFPGKNTRDIEAAVMAQLLKPALDELWNVVGYIHSLSFDEGGKWIGQAYQQIR